MLAVYCPVDVEQDEDLVKELLDFLDCDVTELLSVNRLGKFLADRIAENRFRPLKVRLRSSAARDKVLSSLSKLKHAPSHLNALSIRQDLNFDQRQELNDKIREAKELSRNKTDSIYRVRGSPGDYKLVEVRKNFRQPQLGN
jgi:hypothetical protein